MLVRIQQDLLHRAVVDVSAFSRLYIHALLSGETLYPSIIHLVFAHVVVTVPKAVVRVS
jgi:hypothetical protein